MRVGEGRVEELDLGGSPQSKRDGEQNMRSVARAIVAVAAICSMVKKALLLSGSPFGRVFL